MIVSETLPTSISGNHQEPPARSWGCILSLHNPHLTLLSLHPPHPVLCSFFLSPFLQWPQSCCVSLGLHYSGSLMFLCFPVSCIASCVFAHCPSSCLSLTLSAFPCLPSLTSGSPSSWFSESLSSMSGSPGVSWPLSEHLLSGPTEPHWPHKPSRAEVKSPSQRACLGLPLPV